MRAICPPERRFVKLVLFDTHTHINDERFDADRSEVIENMRRAGVQLAVVVGDAAAQPESAFALADAYYAATVLYPEQFADISIEEKVGEIFTALLGANPYEDLKEAGYAFRPIQLGE